MGQFYITNVRKYDSITYNVIKRAGFKKNKKISVDGTILNVFKKRMIDHENYFIGNNKDFIAVNGTLIYKEVIGKKGLKKLLKDFNDYDIQQIRENSIGHYVVIIKKGDYINIFCDKYNLYDVFYYINENKFVISNSYLGIVESMENRKLNLFALFEETVNGGCIGRENVFEEMYKLLGNDLLKIDCKKNIIRIKRVEYSRTPKKFHKNFDKALKEYADNVKYVFSVMAKNFKEMALELTGGLDTRTVLAALNNDGTDYRILYGISKDAIINSDKEDLEAVNLFAKKYSKELYIMDWENICEPKQISDDLFYKFDIYYKMYGYNKKCLGAYENLNKYPEVFLDGYFGETLKARRWLEVQIFKKKISFKNLIKRYHLTYDTLRIFRSKKIKKEYMRYLINKTRKTAIKDFKIPLIKGKIGLDHFNEVRQLFSRTMDNYDLNFQNRFAYALSPLGDLKLYEPCFNLPFKFRKEDEFESKLIKFLDKSTLEVPLFTHQHPKEIDKDYNLIKQRMTFWEFMGLNFLTPCRIALDFATKILGKGNKNKEYFNKYKNALKKDPIFSRYFDLDKVRKIQTLDKMYSFSNILKRYYYNQH